MKLKIPVFPTKRLLYLLGIASILFLVSFFIKWIYPIGTWMVYCLAALTLAEIVVLFAKGSSLSVTRKVPLRLSNGDANTITLSASSRYPFPVTVSLIDEIPVQLQYRNFHLSFSIKPNQNLDFDYELTPTERGVYSFGKINAYITTAINLVERRVRYNEEADVKVYPSFIQMRKYELMAVNNRLSDIGINKLRSVGKHTEFDMIKEYIEGDDYRTINWNATARKGSLMVNKYLEEKSQHVYSIIDKSRLMFFPFNGLTLLEYAINSTLAFSNIATLKDDKCGLVTFNKDVDTFVYPEKKRSHIHLLMESLYQAKSSWLTSDFELLYVNVKRRMPQRSLIMLYTNFESVNSMKSVLPYLKLIAKQHLLVVVMFENTEIGSLLSTPAQNVEEFYTKTIAEKYRYEKREITSILRRNGILSVLAPPQGITPAVISKYLEIKADSLV